MKCCNSEEPVHARAVCPKMNHLIVTDKKNQKRWEDSENGETDNLRLNGCFL